MRYRAFRTKKDNMFYFQFMSEDGDTILNSQPYQDKNACFNGIKSVIENASNPDRYEKITDGGKHHFILKAGNGQEIGRSVAYDSEGAADQAITNFQQEGPNAMSKSREESGTTTEKASAAPAPATTTKTSGSGGRSDDYKPLAYYESRISGVEDGFDRFNADDEDYFTYNLDGLVVLISEGYQSENARENGIKSVEKNMPNPDRYQRKTHTNGKHYFNLRAGNNQEIATSRWFDDEGQMNSAIDMLTSGTAKAGGNFLRSMGLAGDDDGDAIYPDYKPLEYYQERIEGEEFGYDTFADDDRHYFTVNHEGKPVLISETYQSADGRDNGVNSVKKNVKKEERYERKVHPNGKHYFNLLAGNKQEIATSRWFDDKKEMERAIRWLTSTGGTRRRKKAKRSAPAAERVYVQQNLPYMCSNIKYDTFQSGGNKHYYFLFKKEDDKVILINGDVRGFKTTEDLDAGIERVLKYAPDKKNYVKKTTKNGKHYFYVQDDNEKNVARSSLFYAEESDMNDAIALLACGLGVPVAAAAAPAASTSNRVDDDYLPCEAYAGDTGFHRFYNDDKKEWYFAYNRPNGKTMLRSEGYTSESARENGIQSVTKNSPIAERWKTGTALNDKYHYYALRAGNNQEIARSCYYTSEAEMQADFGWVRGQESSIGVGSALVGGTLMSAMMINRQREAEEAAKLKAAEEARRKQEEADRLKREQEMAEAEILRKKREEEARLEAERAKAAEEARLEAERVKAAEVARLAAEAAKKKPVQDDYLPCDDYKGAKGFHKFQDAETNEYYFSYNNDDGDVMLRSEGYKTLAARDNGIESVKKNAPIKERWKKETALNGKYHYYVLKAGNNQEIARSCYYDNAAAMNTGFLWLGAAFAPVAAAIVPPVVEKAAVVPPPPPPPPPVVKKEPVIAAAAAAAAATPVREEYVEERGGIPWWVWLLLLALLALLAFFLLRGCDGCNEKAVVPPPVVTDTIPEITEVEPAELEPVGPDCDALGLASGSLACDMANYMSAAGSSFPRTYGLDGVSFNRNSATLDSNDKKALDDIIKVLKAYPNATADIRGYLLDNETASYRGSKEITLDDVRARRVYEYLKANGIPDSQINFSGSGSGSSSSPEIVIRRR